ncbi:hypothetical protein HYH03_001338 [Edaphochlamys debaryana]|uniref:Caffeoyl-CoA O-methyltransferase n=1 Tax=Edaphochlamys debaryana TaxID=47281 RepID=A0A835YD90_9CHLO|nr:hypothetical protein HYH03_001338 [Edaphochlamys debaryana]|eukprot:KAG2500568.1 hypothetical protein HYH03_001338 [Edaphochlamys debaryana]
MPARGCAAAKATARSALARGPASPSSAPWPRGLHSVPRAAPAKPSSPPGGADGTFVAGEVVNKQPVAMGMSPELYGYVLRNTREPEVLRRLRAETATVNGAHMQVTPEQGSLLGLLVELLGAVRVLDLGVFTGYSSTAMALALPEDGRVYALDRDERPMQMARKYWAEAGVSGKVEAMVGPGVESLQTLLQREGPGFLDLAFIDADKRQYETYYELLLQLVRPGGLIAIDNTLFHGRVVNPTPEDKAGQALAALNAKLLTDPRVTVVLVPIGDGMTLCRRRR